MEKIKKWRRFALALLSLLFVAIFSFALVQILPARAEETSVTIHADANGKVEYAVSNSQTADGLTYTSVEASGTSESITISEGQFLHLKATAADGCIFRVWSAKGFPNNGSEAEEVLSMKNSDSFSCAELKEQNISNVYAIFTKPSNAEARNSSKLKVKYNAKLGDVFLYIGNANVSKEQIIKHGMWIRSDEDTPLPFFDRRSSICMGNVTFLAVPKEEIPSTLDSTKTTKAMFQNWSASYCFGSNKELSDVQPLPYVANMMRMSYNPLNYEIIPMTTAPDYQVDETWFIPSNLIVDTKGIFSCGVEQVYSDSIWWNEQYKTSTSAKGETTMYVDCDTIVANFQEAAPIPDITVTPSEDETTKDSIALTEYETTIHFPSDCKNSLSFLIEKLQALTENYHVEVFKNYNLTSGERISETINPADVTQGVVGFNLADITSNCSIVITPDYGEDYASPPLIIYVKIDSDNGLEDIISEESEETTVHRCDWEYDPYFNSGNAHAFISGISYPEALEMATISQLHFQVKGSGVFTFEFYLDGLNTEPYGYALYQLGKEITSSAIDFSSGTVTDQSVILAAGQSDPSDYTGGIDYHQCQIKSESVKRLDGSDWCSAAIHISGKEANQTTDIYIAHAVSKLSSTAALIDVRLGHTVMAVRNVAFYQGQSNVSWGIYDGQTTYGTVTAKAGEKSVYQGKIDSGTTIDFSVEYQEEDYIFYGWSDGENLLSTEEALHYTVKGKTDGTSTTKIYAVLAPKGTPYYFRRGGKFYRDLSVAVNDETNLNKDIYVLHSVTISQDVTIPQDVNLIIPFDETFRTHGSAAEGDATIADIAWREHENGYLFRTVTIDVNATLTVRGTLYLGGVVNNEEHNYQGHTSGKYSQIINDGKIVIENGGVVDIYGRVTGTGTVEVMNGGTLYQPFLILDYSGGTNALDLFATGQTPFKRYSMINIECPITVNYGGTLYGHASLYALGGFFLLDQPFVSYDMGGGKGGDGQGHDTFVMLHKNASVKITYDPNQVVDCATTTNGTAGIGKTKMVFEGGATFSYMIFSAAGISVPTNSVYFSIPYNFEVEMNAGSKSGEEIDQTYNQYETKTDFMIMPGASITVGMGATLTLNANVSVYDGLVQGALSTKSYPTAQQLENVKFSKSGNLIINGTLVMGKKIPVAEFDLGGILGGSMGSTTDKTPVPIKFLGIIQTTGSTGRIEIPQGTELSGKIVDGLSSNAAYYFEYETTARVWDKVHNCFGDLVAGHTYTATSGDDFTLNELKYTNTANGAETETLTLSSNMVGSWKVEHTSHSFDFNELTEADKNFAGAKFKEIKHLCGELGCDEGVVILNMDGFSAEEFAATYRGKDFSEEELAAIFRGLFLEAGCEYFKVNVTNASGPIQGANSYVVTVTLMRGYFVGGEGGEASRTFTFTVEQLNITENEDVKVEFVVDINDIVYTGKEQTPNVQSVTVNGLSVTHEAYVWEDNKNAGTAHLKIIGNGNFTGTYDYTFAIKKATLTLTANSAEGDYGTEHNNLGFTLEGAVEGEEAKLKALVTCSTTAGQWSDVGSNYTTSAAFGEDAEGLLKNYDIKQPVNGVYTVKQKDITGVATMSAASVTYNGKEQKAVLQIAFEGYIDYFAADENYTVTYAKGAETTPKNAGTYTVTLTGTGNYTGKITCSYEIKKAAVTVTVTKQEVTYNGKVQDYNDEADGAWTAEGLVNDEEATILDVSISVDGSAQNKGTYNVKGTYNETGNYAVTFTGEASAFVINARNISNANIARIADVIYNGNEQKQSPASVTVSAEGDIVLTLQKTTDYTLSWTEDCTNAGTVTVTVTAAENGNYTGTTTTSYQIAKAKVTITADDKRSPQGQELLDLTATVVGLIGGDTFQKDVDYELTTDATKSSDVNTYTITVTVKDGRVAYWTNYEITPVNGKYQITVAAFADVEFDSTEKPYNGEAQTIVAQLPQSDEGTYSVTYTYWKGAKDSGQSISATQVVDAGTYTIVATVKFANNNGQTYTDDLTVTLTITKVKVTVTFDGQSMVYGETPKSGTGLTYTMSEGVVLEKDQETVKGAISPTTTATNTSAVNGSYTITAEKPELQNYDVTIVDGVYTITPASLTVTIEESSHEYGAAVGALGVTLQGVKNGEEENIKAAIKLTTEAEQWSDKGNYAIKAEYEAKTGVLANYDVEVANNNAEIYEVTVKDITDVAIMSASDKTYSGKAQEAELMIVFENYLAHFIKDTDYTVSYKKGESAVTPLNADSYTVTVTGKGNYAGTIECAFVIGKATIDAVVVEDAYTYTGEVQKPVLKVTATGGDNAVLTLSEGEYEAAYTKGGETAAVKDAGRYTVTITSKSGNYQTAGAVSTTFEIAKAKITVKADDVKTVYGEATYGSAGKPFPFTVKEDTPLLGGDQKDVLHVDLYVGATVNEAKTYTITGTGSADNYDVTVEDGTYTVEQRKVTITIKDQEKEYDGTVPTVADSEWTAPENAIVAGDNLFVKLTVQDAAADVLMKDGKVSGYTITGEATNSNYDVEFVEGTYTVKPRAVTVEIYNQSATYDFALAGKNGYTFNAAAWAVEAESLAPGEEKAVLGITLQKPEMSDAGEYAITGSAANANYAVTFTGKYAGAGESAGKAGVYTVMKKDVSLEALFVLLINGESEGTEGASTFYAKYAGDPLTLTGGATVNENDARALNVTIDPEIIEKIGNYPVTLTIEDKNYCGSTEFTVIVADKDGYTENLLSTLDALEKLVAGLDIDHLTTADYATLSAMYKALQGLSDEERETGAEKLAKYQAYIDAWEELADIEDVIETAEEIADAPIAALFEAAAALTALAGLAYIAIKGGIL